MKIRYTIQRCPDPRCWLVYRNGKLFRIYRTRAKARGFVKMRRRPRR